MDEMAKEFITAPVVLEDEGYEGGWFIMYVKEEGMMFDALPMRSEDEADDFMKEFERSGTMTMHNPLKVSYEVLEPVFMLKVRAIKAVRKQWRYIEVEGDKFPKS